MGNSAASHLGRTVSITAGVLRYAQPFSDKNRFLKQFLTCCVDTYVIKVTNCVGRRMIVICPVYLSLFVVSMHCSHFPVPAGKSVNLTMLFERLTFLQWQFGESTQGHFQRLTRCVRRHTEFFSSNFIIVENRIWPLKTICMKCQILFLVTKINLSPAEFA